MTNQQHADELLSEYQANRGRNMTLFDYDLKVKPHLNYIEAGANMAIRHANALPFKPDFTTHAQDELAEARTILEAALHNVIAAQSIYQSKPAESQAA